MRLADMWLRPRTGQLWIELRWWQYEHHPAETIFSWSYAALNLAYLLLAAWGLKKRVPFAGVMVAYVVLRCLLLLTLETPESRYTLECFPDDLHPRRSRDCWTGSSLPSKYSGDSSL